jgi:hypothetical protein
MNAMFISGSYMNAMFISGPYINAVFIGGPYMNAMFNPQFSPSVFFKNFRCDTLFDTFT